MNRSQFSISVVIPNFNGKKLLEVNLPFLIAALKKVGVEHEIIISDDCSTDDSINFIKTNYPEIILVQQQVNQGFSPTINLGIRKATRKLVFALNNDVQLTEDYFLKQLTYFEDKTTFGVMGRIIGLTSDEVQDASKFPKIKGYKIKATSNFIPANIPSGYKVPTFFLSGANALVDREKLMELNGFDEVYRPFYLEDVDLSLRAWRLGWKCYYEHESICRHPASATIKTYHKELRIKSVSLSNRLIMHYIHLNGLLRALWILGILAEFLTSWITYKIYFYKGFFLFIDRLKEAKISRRKFQDLQKKHQSNLSISGLVKQIKASIQTITIQRI